MDSEEEIIDSATKLCGDREHAKWWYKTQPIEPLDNLTAEQLVAQGRADRVLKYIDTLYAGTG